MISRISLKPNPKNYLDLQSQIIIATTLAIKRPYPERKVVKTEADARIFHGQIANARNSTRNCPRGMVKYRGNSNVLSDPKGIMLAAMFVPRIDTIHVNADRKIANLVEADQYLSKMAPSRSQGFQRSKPQVLLIAAVAKIPREADNVTPIGCVINCDHCAPDLVLLHRAISGWFVMSVAVFPIPLLIAYIINQPLLFVILEAYTDPTLPFVLTIQNMNNPHTAGRTIIDFTQKNIRS